MRTKASGRQVNLYSTLDKILMENKQPLHKMEGRVSERENHSV